MSNRKFNSGCEPAARGTALLLGTTEMFEVVLLKMFKNEHLQVTNTTMMHQSQQEAIIITLMWRVGTTAFHSEKHKPPKRVHTHLEHNLI